MVTGTFVHRSAEVLDLVFAPSSQFSTDSRLFPGGSLAVAGFETDRPRFQTVATTQTIGVTAVHPFWSVTRDDFVPAGELVLGEEVVTIDGQIWRLTSITPRAGPETVYNFEVAREHVYYVTSDGLLVHNACGTYVYTVVKNGRPVYIGMGIAKRVDTALSKVAKKLGTSVDDLVKQGYKIRWENMGSKAAARGMEQYLIKKAMDQGMKMTSRGLKNGQFMVDKSTLVNKVWSYATSRIVRGNSGFDYQKEYLRGANRSLVDWWFR